MKKLPLLLFLSGLSLPGWSETIIEGPLGIRAWEISYQQSVVASWTVSSSFANVSIATPLWMTVRDLSATGTAYLTSSVPGSPTLSTGFMFPTIPPGETVASQYVGLFDNLTLSPGTYYLTLMSPVRNTAAGWINFSPLAGVQTASGIALGPTYAGFPADGPYVGQTPSPSGFRDNTDFGRSGLRILGDPSGDFGGDPVLTAAPEPPTYALVFGLALLVFAAWCKRRMFECGLYSNVI